MNRGDTSQSITIIALFAQEFVSDVQTDLVTELRIGIGEKVFIRDVVNESVVVEDPVSLDLVKEGCLYLWIGEQ